jgi:hypothetical protein
MEIEMRIFVKLLFALMFLSFFNCATIVKGSKQNLTFVVSEEEDADITLYDLGNNSETKIGSGKSGVKYELKTGKGFFKKARYKVVAIQGIQKSERFLESKLNWKWYLGGNVLFFGPVTGLIGYLIVDPITGAMWELDVENNQVEMHFIKGTNTQNCDFFNQTVTLKNQEILKNVVIGIVPNYVVVFTNEGKTWVYPKAEVKSAENSMSSKTEEKESTTKSCDFFFQSVALKKGKVIQDTITAVTTEYVVVLLKEGKVLVYPKKEVKNVENKTK